MGKDPEAIEHEIEETRVRMGERVDALSYKADVPSRVGDRLTETRQAVGGKLDELKSAATDRAPSRYEMRQRTQQAVGWMRQNPFAVAAGAMAAGVLVGLVLPSTNAEDERLGEAADQVKSRALDTGQEALDRGRQVARDAARTAQESGSHHASELAANASQDAAEVTRGGAGDQG